MVTNTKVVLNKGGTGEKTVAISDIYVPDLWNTAMTLRDDGYRLMADKVLDCWHLAHSLKIHIQEADN